MTEVLKELNIGITNNSVSIHYEVLIRNNEHTVMLRDMTSAEYNSIAGKNLGPISKFYLSPAEYKLIVPALTTPFDDLPLLLVDIIEDVKAVSPDAKFHVILVACFYKLLVVKRLEKGI